MRLSVVIPCHNAATYLAQTIGSLLEQSRRPDEIIVVDDGSTDGSAEIAARFGSEVQLVRGKFGNAPATRNHGFSFATGDAVMFLDADDVLGPDALYGLVSALASNPRGLAVCPWERLEKSGEKWVRRPPSWPALDPRFDRLGNWLMGRYYSPCSVLWSREAYLATGGWDERAKVNNDGDLMMRAMIQGIPVNEASEGTSFYRRLPEGEVSLSGFRYTEDGLRASLYVLRKVAYLLEEQGKARRYRRPLDAAVKRILDECGDRFPEIARECEIFRRRYGERPQVPRARERLACNLARGRGVLRRLTGRRRSALSPRSEEEVASGLTHAERASGSTPSPGEISPLPAPVVSVVIPTYNRARLVLRAIRSVQAQTFADFEILVVDDGSKDDTAEVIAAVDDPRLRYLPQPENRGVSAARNRGMREARGSLIAFLDSDDEWLPEKLERQVKRFESLPDDFGLVYTGVESLQPDGRSWVFHPAERGKVYERLLETNIIHSGSGVMLRRNVVRVAGFFDEGIPAIEDYDYWLRIARFYQFEFIDEPLLRYHDAADPDRKSLANDDNMRAREWFFRKHHREMKRHGVAHRFLLESAQRILHAGTREAQLAALKLTLRALRWAPRKYEPYSFLMRVTFPDRLHSAIRRVRSARSSKKNGGTALSGATVPK